MDNVQQMKLSHYFPQQGQCLGKPVQPLRQHENLCQLVNQYWRPYSQLRLFDTSRTAGERYIRGGNSTKCFLTSSPSLMTPATECWWVKKGLWLCVDNKTLNLLWVVDGRGEGCDVGKEEKKHKHASGMWWSGISPPRWAAGKSLKCSVCGKRDWGRHV